MQFRSGLSLFERTGGARSWNIASFHSPHSLTWRWILSFSLFRKGEAKVFPLWWGGRYFKGSGNGQWGFRLPWIGIVHFLTQQPMWYRDLYQNKQDELFHLRNELRINAELTPETKP